MAIEPVKTWLLSFNEAPYRAAALATDKVAFVTENRQRVILLSGEDRHLIASFPEASINSIAADRNVIWVGVAHQLFSIDPVTHNLSLEYDFGAGHTISSR